LGAGGDPKDGEDVQPDSKIEGPKNGTGRQAKHLVWIKQDVIFCDLQNALIRCGSVLGRYT